MHKRSPSDPEFLGPCVSLIDGHCQIYKSVRALAMIANRSYRRVRWKHKQRNGVIMPIKRIQTGPRMSQAVIHNKTVYLAGQVAPGASVAIQTREILASIDALLAEANTDKSRLLSATHLAHGHGYFRGNERRMAVVGDSGRDSRACNCRESSPGIHGIQDRNRRRRCATLDSSASTVPSCSSCRISLKPSRTDPSSPT